MVHLSFIKKDFQAQKKELEDSEKLHSSAELEENLKCMIRKITGQSQGKIVKIENMPLHVPDTPAASSRQPNDLF